MMRTMGLQQGEAGAGIGEGGTPLMRRTKTTRRRRRRRVPQISDGEGGGGGVDGHLHRHRGRLAWHFGLGWRLGTAVRGCVACMVNGTTRLVDGLVCVCTVVDGGNRPDEEEEDELREVEGYGEADEMDEGYDPSIRR